jgi:hypothetical protein
MIVRNITLMLHSIIVCFFCYSAFLKNYPVHLLYFRVIGKSYAIVRVVISTCIKFCIRLLQELGQQQRDNTGEGGAAIPTEQQQRLNSLYERQNSKREAARGTRDRPPVVRPEPTSRPPPAKQRTFERGDLRHSLREKRAARKIRREDWII